MFLNNRNKRLKPILNGRAIKIIQNILNTPYKIYKLNVDDSTTEYNDIKIALDDDIEMEVGDDLGIVAHLLPHTYLRTNTFDLKTSNRNVVDIDGMVMTAKGPGTATITATTLDGKHSDSITVNVTKPYEFTATSAETYTLDPNLFGLVEYNPNNDLEVEEEQAWKNSNAIGFLFMYMNRKGYKKVVFPKNKTYLFHPVNTIYCKNNIIVDLNGSTLQAVPHLVTTSTGIVMSDSRNKIDICPRGWTGLNRVAMNRFEISSTDYYYDYDGYSYNLPRTNANSSYYVDGEIPVITSDSTSTEYRNYIVKGKTYNGTFKFSKYMLYSIDRTSYTANSIKLIAECYKNNSLVEEKELFSYYWNTYNFVGSRDFSFSITSDVDIIKIKVTGMEESNGTEVISTLGDLKIYALDEDIQEFTENIVFENGSILGDGMLKDNYGNEIKTNIFKEAFNTDWRNIQKTEHNINISFKKGYYIGCRNMTIGNSVGFNIGIDTGRCINGYFPNGNLMELGGLDDQGNAVERTDYARFSEYLEIDISSSNKIRIVDPTFSTNYYFKYQSRIIDVYCYDSSKNFIRAFKGKFRHGLLSIPENTKYIKLAVPLLVNQGEVLITDGNPDFYNCIFAIEIVEPITKGFLKNCIIENNYSTGIAHSGGNFLIEGCTFTNNIGRMPWCDIDCEDGWMKMQNNIFRNNTFNSYWGTIMCAGTNFVFKNNIYNGSFTMYGQCQYFKIIGNTFKSTTNPGIEAQSDTYIINNDFSGIKQINTNKQHPLNSEYKIYYGDNTFADIILNNSKNTIYDVGKNRYKSVSITGDADTTEIFIGKSINYLNEKLTINKDLELSNLIIPVVSSINTARATFNNCTFYNDVNFLIAKSNAIFNTCTLYNRNLLSDSKITYNDCTFIDGINTETLLDGIVTDGLIFNKCNITSYAGQKMQELKVGTNEFGDFTVSCSVNPINNFDFHPLIGCCIKQLGFSFIKNDFGGTNIVTIPSMGYNRIANKGNLSNTNYYVGTMTYNSTLKQFKCYLNNTLLGEVTLREGTVFDDHANYSDNNALMRTIGQSKVNHYYLYNRVLTEDEITQNISVLSATFPEATIYGDIVTDTNVSLTEDGNYDLAVKLNKQPTKEQNIVVSFLRYNVGLDKVKLTFTPDNYNNEQHITLKGIKDNFSASDKKDTITITTDRDGYTTTQDLYENNIIGGEPSTIKVSIKNTVSDSIYSDSNALASKIKNDYPDECINFKGSFDWDTFTQTTLDSNVAGDFWINDKMTLRKVIHSRIFEPNDIMYYDGEFLNPLHMNKENSNVQSHYDVCIVGGGAGGVACGMALKDKGLKVCLIEKLDTLGGTHINSVTQLIPTPIVPYKNNWLRNILEECYDTNKLRLSQYADTEPIGGGTIFDGIWRSSQITYNSSHRGVQFFLSPSYMMARYYNDLKDTIDIKLRTEFISSTLDENKVTSISVKNLDTNEIYTISANYFVDCSADGVLCRYGKILDTDFYIGTDPKDRFNEASYPDGSIGDHYNINTVEGSYFISSGKIDNTDKTRNCDYSDVETFDDVYPKDNGIGGDKYCGGYEVVSTSSGCSIDTKVFIDEGNDAALALAKRRSKYFAYLKGHNYIGQKMLGIRESYRIKCDRMLTQTDIETRPTSNSIIDNHIIALSTWWADLHNAVVSVANSGLNAIPYESLIPSAFTNVLIGSRCLGSSHLAHSAVRLTKTMMSIGYVCGLALDQCVKGNIDNVRNIDVTQIQDEIGILDLFTEVDTWQKIGNGEL